MVREPVVAGMFYEKDKEALLKQIEDCFLSSFGPGRLPSINETGVKEDILGIVSPHAGYAFSGMCAAHGFKELAETDKTDIYILLGLSHSGMPSCVSKEDWRTPLGVVKNEKQITEDIMEQCRLLVNENAHSNEHSIEVQIPFIQYINEQILNNNDFGIVPVIISEDLDFEKFGVALARVIKEWGEKGKKIKLIASSDFTHYGVNYGYIPFTDNKKESMEKLDKGAIQEILKLDSIGFLDYINKTGATICGKYPIAALIEICRNLHAEKGRLLKYYSSGDVIGEYSSMVGYGSIILKK